MLTCSLRVLRFYATPPLSAKSRDREGETHPNLSKVAMYRVGVKFFHCVQAGGHLCPPACRIVRRSYSQSPASNGA